MSPHFIYTVSTINTLLLWSPHTVLYFHTYCVIGPPGSEIANYWVKQHKLCRYWFTTFPSLWAQLSYFSRGVMFFMNIRHLYILLAGAPRRACGRKGLNLNKKRHTEQNFGGYEKKYLYFSVETMRGRWRKKKVQNFYYVFLSWSETYRKKNLRV